MKYMYLEIRNIKTDEAVKRINVTTKALREIERAERGMNINLNHNEYYTTIEPSNTALKEI